MEAFLTALQSALALKARQGWIFFLFGGCMLLCFRFGLLPATEVLPGWYALFAAITILGLIILVVSLGSVILSELAERDATSEARARRKAESEHVDEMAVQNLSVLNDIEEKALAWILQNGQQRFQTEFGRYDGNNLQAKLIIYQLRSDPSDVFRVNPAVWERRPDLLQRYRRYPKTELPPWNAW